VLLLRFDALATDEGAARRTKVLEQQAPILYPQCGMAPGNGDVVHGDTHALAAPKDGVG
jgi:hypothetical protein